MYVTGSAIRRGLALLAQLFLASVCGGALAQGICHYAYAGRRGRYGDRARTADCVKSFRVHRPAYFVGVKPG